jgi:hypothetical protein
MNASKLKGRRYYALARCSTNDQAETSLPDQIKLIRSYADRHGMIYAGAIMRDVTGSLPGARTEFDELIEKKAKGEDFDAVLLQDPTRLTRSGPQHAFAIKEKLFDAGIDILFAHDNRPEGDYGEIVETFEHIAGKLYSKKLSHAVARGLMSSMEQGRVSHTLCVPYGIDRLYVSFDEQPLHVIRNLADGTQVKLDPVTGGVRETYPVGCRNHYRMQSNEKVVLIPGDPRRQEAVRHAFRRWIVDGWKWYRIAAELDRLGHTSSKGQPWSAGSVRNMLLNSVYTGVGVANRCTFARYNCRSHAEPKEVEVTGQMLKKKKLPRRLRPPTEWIRIEHPQLLDYLGDLRNAAIQMQDAAWVKLVSPPRKRQKNGDRHADSNYILKGLLRSTEGDYPLSGRSGYNAAKKLHRYYAVHRAFTIPSHGRHMRRLIPATELERTVVERLRDVLLNIPDVQAVIERMIRDELESRGTPDGERLQLEARRNKLAQQIEVVLETLTEPGRDAVKERMQRINAELAEVTARRAQLQKMEARQIDDPTTLAEQVMNKLRSLAERLEDLPRAALRTILRLFISRLAVDMATKNIEIEFALPNWVALVDLPEDDVRLATTSENAFGGQANTANELKIAVYDCRGIDRRHLRMTTCFECRRRRAA